MSFAAAIEQATKEAVCSWLANGGNAAVATWIVNGSRTPWTAVAGGAAALGLLAVNYGCNYDPNKTTGDSGISNSNCTGATHWLLIEDGAPSYGVWKSFGLLTEWDFVRWTTNNNPEFRNKGTGALFQATDYSKALNAKVAYGSMSGAVWVPCATPPAGLPQPYPPHTYTDPVTNCTYVVDHEAFVMDEAGNVTPVLKISPGAQTRAGGGVIGGCNFNPVIHIPPGGGGDGGGGGGGIYPWQPGPDGPNGEPWWWDVAKGAIGSVIGAAINRMIDKLLEQKVPATVYRLVSVCETDAQGEAISQAREVQIPSLPILDALVARADAMDDLMQGLKDFKQPICPPVKPQLTGEWVTVNFLSDEPSPAGKSRLRKYFRYRDQNFAPLEDHIAHWENFTWEAGDVIVVSKNLSWGTPKVWAASAEEGKRVIGHAAQVAGVDLSDPKHEWIVTHSDDPRYGMPGTMRVDTRGGNFIRVTKRPGPSGFPVGAVPTS